MSRSEGLMAALRSNDGVASEGGVARQGRRDGGVVEQKSDGDVMSRERGEEATRGLAVRAWQGGGEGAGCESGGEE